jgi:thioredoxin-like negative regulator of GroEL
MVGVEAMRTGMRVAGLGVAVAVALVTAGRQAAEAYYSSTWYEDAGGYEQAVRQQHSLHAPMLVYFRVDWCPHCRALDEMLQAYEVRSRLNEFIKVRINPEHGDAEKALFQSRYGSSGYPALFMLRDGGAAARISTAGPPERFLRQLP